MKHYCTRCGQVKAILFAVDDWFAYYLCQQPGCHHDWKEPV